MDLDRLAERTPRTLEGDEREAAVLIPIIERTSGTHLLFTKRSEQVTDHPGQMSFPGGSREPGDVDLYETAVREANEEVGLPREVAEPIGRLDDIRTVTDFVVTPIVAWVPDLAFEPDGREIIEIAILPVEAFLQATNYECEWRSRDPGSGRRVHYFHVEGYTIWGATGRLMTQLLELTTEWRAEQPPHR